MSTPTETTTIDPADMDRLDRIAAAKVEAAAVKAALAADKPVPPTPVLDWMTNKMEKRQPRVPRSARIPMRYFRNGKPINERYNDTGLSYMAFRFTKGIDGDAARIPTAKFIDLLVEGGATDPRQADFDVKLSNGLTISGRVHGSEAPVAVVETPKAKAPAKKAATTKKASAKKATAKPESKSSRTLHAAAAEKAAKTPARKALARESVTPRPKAGKSTAA